MPFACAVFCIMLIIRNAAFLLFHTILRNLKQISHKIFINYLPQFNPLHHQKFKDWPTDGTTSKAPCIGIDEPLGNSSAFHVFTKSVNQGMFEELFFRMFECFKFQSVNVSLKLSVSEMVNFI